VLNRVVLIGRWVQDLELRYTQSGTAVANGRLAVDRPFRNQSGEQEADFLDVVMWRNNAENSAQYTGKGSLVAVEGRLQARSYDDRDGVRRRAVEIVADSVQFLQANRQEDDDEEAPF